MRGQDRAGSRKSRDRPCKGQDRTGTPVSSVIAPHEGLRGRLVGRPYLFREHGHQPKAEWNGFYRGRIYHPLITSLAETGDARLRPGNVGTAEGAPDVILDGERQRATA